MDTTACAAFEFVNSVFVVANAAEHLLTLCPVSAEVSIAHRIHLPAAFSFVKVTTLSLSRSLLLPHNTISQSGEPLS
jgi:hypothetical protein